MRHLNRRKFPNQDRHALFIFLDVFVFQLNDTPDTTAEQTVVFLRVLLPDGDILQAKVREVGNIDVLLHIQPHRNHINHCVAALAAEPGKILLRFIRADEVVRQNALNILYALFDYFGIVRAAVLTQQELKDVNRYIGTFLDFLCEVLADNFTVKALAEFFLMISRVLALDSIVSMYYLLRVNVRRN